MISKKIMNKAIELEKEFKIKDLEREIQSDLNRIATLEREVEAYV